MANEDEIDDDVEYIPEYDISSDGLNRAFRPSNPSGVTYNDIISTGFEFEVSQDDNEETDSANASQYWTREEIIRNLENNPRPDDDLYGENASFDDRIPHMQVIVANGVYKRVIREGTGDCISKDSAVMYHLNAFLEGQDEPFDSTWLRGKPYLHRLNYDTILEGLCYGLQTMKRGERCELICRPQFAYLEMGCPPRVPENSTILYIVEVVRIFEEGSLAHYETLGFEDRERVDFEELYHLCDVERMSGNSYFKHDRYKEAAFRYRRAIRNLEQLTYKTKADEKKSKEMLIKLYVNIANCYNKIQNPMMAMHNCKKALEIDKQYVKALFHYGRAKMINGNYDAARHLLLQAHQLKPDNGDIIDLLTKLDKRMANDKLEDKELYKRMASVFKDSNS